MIRAVKGNYRCRVSGNFGGVCEGVKKGFLERVTYKVRLTGRWDLAEPGGRGRGAQAESVVDDVKAFGVERA